MIIIVVCGDVNCNVMCSFFFIEFKYYRQVYVCFQKISDYFFLNIIVYYEIWFIDENDKKIQVVGDVVQDFEFLYGFIYFFCKFKIIIVIFFYNDIDVYVYDIGLIVIKGKDGEFEGFNVFVGGGMGVIYNNKKIYFQIGCMFGYCKVDEIYIVCEKIMLVQCDYGDCKNCKYVCLKYIIDDMGVDVFCVKIEEFWGKKFEKECFFEFKSNIDIFGWQKDEKGFNYFIFFIENGCIEDIFEFQMKIGFCEIVKIYKGEFCFIGNQYLIFSNVVDEDLFVFKELMKKYKFDNY